MYYIHITILPMYHMRKFRSMPSLLIAFFGSSHADDVVVAVNCFSKMMMAAGAESPAVATQSAKTDILQKIGQRGNNHQETEAALGRIRYENFAKKYGGT